MAVLQLEVKKDVLVSSSSSFDLLCFFPEHVPLLHWTALYMLRFVFLDRESQATPHFAKCLGLDLFGVGVTLAEFDFCLPSS